MLVPDDKDWTWVLERPCPECSFDTTICTIELLPDLVRHNSEEWRRLFAAGAIRPGRTDASAWSALEYACHVRDVYRLYEQRISLMRREDDPLFPNWDQDATAIDDRYDSQDPGKVVEELSAAAETIALVLQSLSGDEWDRPGRRSDGAAFTIFTIARYMIHDPIHHISDITMGGSTRADPVSPHR